jgi:hypothetical protein
MLTSRRTLVAGLATLPVLAITAAAKTTVDTVGGQEDPIFAAIERHRAAMAALEDFDDDEDAEIDAYAEAEQELSASYEALLATVPQTIPGCRALVDHMIEGLGAGFDEALEVLREALGRLAERGAA